MSASEVAGLNTRSRSRSNSRSLFHIHPAEELAKHGDVGRAAKFANMDVPTVTTRRQAAAESQHHHIHHHHHDYHQELSKDTQAPGDASMGTRSRSRSRIGDTHGFSSVREPTVSLSTHRVLSYGPSDDDVHVHHNLQSMDSTHSRDEGGGGGGGGGTKSSDSLSSSKTGGHENAVHMGNNGVHIKSSSSPSAEAASIIFTREALLPVLFSMLFLGLIVFGFLHVGGPVSNRLTQTLKAIGFTSGIWKPTSTTSLQVQELHERLMQTLKVSTKRLEDRVDGLKAEMEAEIARQKQETEEIRREIRSRGMLEKEMKNADRDGFLDVSVSSILERPDYALGTGGGRVVGHSAAYKPSSSSSFKWFDRIHGFLARSGALHPLAPMILQPSFNQPGQCLPLAGSDVYVEVALRTAIFPDQVTLSHVSKEDGDVDHYARHEELFKKRLSILRESMELVEQRRRMTRERSSSSNLKHVVLRLKQSQADALDVKFKNQKLLQHVDDMLREKQAQFPELSAVKVANKELCWENSINVRNRTLDDACSDSVQVTVINTSGNDKGGQNPATSHVKLDDLQSLGKTLNDTSFNNGQEEVVAVRNFPNDKEQQNQGTSHTKLEDLRSKIKKIDIYGSHSTLNASIPFEEAFMKANVERAMQDAVVSLQTSIPGQTSLLTENQVIEQTVMAPPSNPVDDLNLSEKIQHHIDSKNWSRPATPEEINDALLVKSSPTASISQLMEQKSEQMTQHEQKILEHHDEYCKRKLLLCMHLEESEIGGSHGRFLLTGVGDQLQDKERILVRSRRAELAVSASKEKLTILNNIYSAVQQWEYTLWACANKQAWNPGLVFATIEAAKVSNKEVNKILGTIDSDLRLLICCEAICELTHAFPPECLLPTRFVEERLLAATSDRSNVQDWVTRSLLKEYQDIESQMFWDSLTRYAIYLVTQELATAKQIASVFTGILLPVPRLKDTTKDAVEHARATLHIFISTLLGKKAADVGANDTSAICLSQVKTPCTSDSRAWHQNKEVAVYKQESHGTEDKDSGLLPLVEIPMLYAEEDAMEELSSNASKSRRAPSCLSCVMLMKCLPWKKSKL